MRFVLVITLLINSLPIVAPIRAATAASSPKPFIAIPDDTPAPTPTPTPDPVLEQAKREALIADELKKKAIADKDRAVAEAEKLKALALPFGTPSNVEIPTGNVQTDAAGWVESQMLAHEAARQITRDLVRKLCRDRFVQEGTLVVHASAGNGAEQPQAESNNTGISNLVIHNSNDLTGVELYNAVVGQLEQLLVEFRTANTDAAALLQKTDPSATPSPTTSSTSPTTSALPLLAAPGIATGIIKSVAELVNLFRTETKFENKSVQISEDMVVSHVAAMLAANAATLSSGSTDGRCNQNMNIYYPALFPARLVQSSSTSRIVGILNEVERQKNTAALYVERIDGRIKELNGLAAKMDELDKNQKTKKAKEDELAKLKKQAETACRKPSSPTCRRLKREIKEIEEKVIPEIVKAIFDLSESLSAIVNPDVKTKPKIKQALAKLEEQKTNLQSLINSTELLSSRLNTPDADTKLTALAQLLRAEKLHNILRNPETFTLRVAVTANGTTKIKKNLFVDAKVRHSAGANLVYQLFNSEGAIAQGDVMQCYLDYRSAGDVHQIVSNNIQVKCHADSNFNGQPKPKTTEAGK